MIIEYMYILHVGNHTEEIELYNLQVVLPASPSYIYLKKKKADLYHMD